MPNFRTTIFDVLGHDNRLDRLELDAGSIAPGQEAIHRSEIGGSRARVAYLGYEIFDEAFLRFWSRGFNQCRHECVCGHGELTADRNQVMV